MELEDILRRPERWASVLGWATFAGLEFGLIGPFGSYEANVYRRLVYWIGLFWVGSLLLWPAVIAALVVGTKRGFPPLFSGVAVMIVACIPLAALGAAGTHLFWPLHASGMKTFEWYGLTIVVALPAMGGLVWLELGRTGIIRARSRAIAQGGPQALAEPNDAPALPAPRLALPDHLLATALCLQMEDHHVRVHMHGHSQLHFASMRQVVSTLEEGRGLQVHRSWWVALGAVEGWYQEGRSVVLVLVNGLRVPVARNRIAVVRAHGWLDGKEWRGNSDQA
jgi:hypothetical protein